MTLFDLQFKISFKHETFFVLFLHTVFIFLLNCETLQVGLLQQ